MNARKECSRRYTFVNYEEARAYSFQYEPTIIANKSLYLSGE